MQWTLNKNDDRTRKFSSKVLQYSQYVVDAPYPFSSNCCTLLNEHVTLTDFVMSNIDTCGTVFNNGQYNYLVPVNFLTLSCQIEWQPLNARYSRRSSGTTDNTAHLKEWPLFAIQVGDLLRWAYQGVSTDKETKRGAMSSQIIKMDTGQYKLSNISQILGFYGFDNHDNLLKWTFNGTAPVFNSLAEYCNLYILFDIAHFLRAKQVCPLQIASFWLGKARSAKMVELLEQYYTGENKVNMELEPCRIRFDDPKSLVKLIKEYHEQEDSASSRRSLKEVTRPLNKHQMELLETKYKPATFKTLRRAHAQGYVGWMMRNVSIWEWHDQDIYYLPDRRDTQSLEHQKYKFKSRKQRQHITVDQAHEMKYRGRCGRRNSWNLASMIQALEDKKKDLVALCKEDAEMVKQDEIDCNV